jgi:actin-related protein 10
MVAQPPPSLDEPMTEDMDEADRALTALAEIYSQNSRAKDLLFPIPAPGDMGPGNLVIPGWIRERASEVLFQDDRDSESDSIPETILQTLLKVGAWLAESKLCLC